jgi:hypothetical protein
MKENNIPESFENAMNDLVVGRVVPLNTALNEPYKELDNSDSLKLHNHVLKVANEDLAIMVKKMEETLYNIWQCFEIKNELYMSDEDGFYASAHKARLCLKDIGSELIKE